MIKLLAIAALVITVNVIIQAFAIVLLTRRTRRHFILENEKISNTSIGRILIMSFLFITLVHFIQTIVWALCYYLHPEIQQDFTSFAEALYFSFVTFTSLGYGDITLTSNYRLLTGIEAINGIMLIGWSTAMMYSLIQSINKALETKR